MPSQCKAQTTGLTSNHERDKRVVSLSAVSRPPSALGQGLAFCLTSLPVRHLSIRFLTDRLTD
eukprot:1179793-Prorocentrum_minimum.AAC.2